MKYKRCGTRVFVRIDKGEELIENLKAICKELNITLGSICGIGATDKVTVGLMNTKTKKYQSKEFTGDHEITSVLGNVTTMNGEIYLHLHITLGNVEHKIIGGHLTSAVISATFEGIIDIIEGQITREYHDEVGLNLLRL
jgi:predicted DNA-binding protein with PD1-like motif